MKKLLLSLGFSLLLPLAAIAQTPSFSTHSASSTVVVQLHGDVNNDGFEDLIGGSATGFSVLLSNGDGTYRAPIITTAPSSVVIKLLGDFNGDGKLDLVAENVNANNTYGFSIYFGNGDGTFRAPVQYAVTGQLAGIAAADVNGDNKTDLLIDSTTDGGSTYDVQVFLNKGDGTFSSGPTTYNTNAGAGIAIGDFNGDGKVDFAAFNAGDGYSDIGIFIGNDTGAFTKTYSNSSSSDSASVVADVNGDGRSDLIGVANTSNNVPYLDVFYGNSDGTMTPNQIPTANCVSGTVAVADFNGDQIPDIAVPETSCSSSGTATTTMTILSGKGNNQFGPETSVYSSTKYVNILQLSSDLRGNRDTKPDLVFNSGAIITLLNTTSGNFPTCNAPDAATGIALCSPASGSTVSSPVNFAIGAAGAVAMRKVEVWVDGSKLAEQLPEAFSYYSFLNASVPLSAGSHKVTVYAAGVDNSLQSKSFTLDVASSSCSAPTSAGVHVCQPASGASVSSPVAIQATSTITGKFDRMEVWVDGVKKYTETSGTTLKTTLSVAAGSHRFGIFAVNTAGTKWEGVVDATVK